MKKSEIVNTPKNTKIIFSTPEKFIGMKIVKAEVVSECTAIEPYMREDGVEVYLLIWRQTCSKSGVVKIRKTSSDFRIGDVPSRFKN